VRRFYRRGCNYRLLILALGAVLLLHEAQAAAPCTGMPPSKLLIFDIKPADPQIVVLPPEALDRQPPDDLASRHAFMLSDARIVTWFEITHRIIPRDDGSVCDAPVMVRVGFGLDRRIVLLARPAAKNACLRRAMLDHERAHIQALNEVVDDMIARRTADMKRGMVALKQSPAPDGNAATLQWQAGLRAIVMEVRQEMFERLRKAVAETDRPSAIAALQNACGGAVRRLEGQRG
jgi:hypothetical protein